jgi:uncharacterized protein YidB (DUF937 family)
MDGRMNSANTLTSNLAKKNSQVLERNLVAFAYRFPVSGRIVHALAQECGGVIGLADYIEKHGMKESAGAWIKNEKTDSLHPENIRKIFDEEILDSVARHLAIPRESVEIQAALSIPRFFGTLGHDEDDDLDFGYSHKRNLEHPENPGSSIVDGLHDFWPDRGGHGH